MFDTILNKTLDIISQIMIGSAVYLHLALKLSTLIMVNDKINWTKLIVSDAESDGQRLDNYLLTRLDYLERGSLYKLIRKKDIIVNGRRAAHGYRVQVDDIIQVYRGVINTKPELNKLKQTNCDWVKDIVIYQDEEIIAINKPAGVAVHGGSGVKTGLIDICRKAFDSDKLSLVHRLDRMSSGVLIIARGRHAMQKYSKLLAARQWSKYYEIVVKGCWEPKGWVTLEDSLSADGKISSGVASKQQEAIAKYKCLAVAEGYSRLLVKLITGRKHQIRRQCIARGHAVVGESLYAKEGNDSLQRLFLHCAKIQIIDESGNKIVIKADLPSDLTSWLEKRRWEIVDRI